MSSIPHNNSYVNHLTDSSFVVVFQYPIYPPSPPEERAIVAKKAVTNVWKQFQKPLSRPQHQHTNLRSACVRDTIWFVHMFTPSKARWLTIPPALYVTSSSPSVSNNSLTGTSSLKKLKRFSVCEARARDDQAKRINTLKALVLSYHLRSTFLECFSKDLRKNHSNHEGQFEQRKIFRGSKVNSRKQASYHSTEIPARITKSRFARLDL